MITVPDQFAFTPEQVAELLQTHRKTILRNIRRPETDRLHLKAFKVGERDLRVTAEALQEFIKRNEV